MKKPVELNSSTDSLINKSVHTSDGVLIGNVHYVDNTSVIVKRDVITTVYYHIPIRQVREWDGHAIWLTIGDKESKKHIFQTPNRKEPAAESLALEFEQDVLNQIIYHAEHHGLSLTNYINQILKRYFEWDRFEPKDGIVMLCAPVVRELFNNLTAAQIIVMAKNMAKNLLQKTVAKFAIERQNMDFNFFLSWLEDEMNNFAIEIRHIVSKDREDISDSPGGSNIHGRSSHHIFILRHDAGKNYSLYYKTMLEAIFNDVLQKNIFVITTGSTIRFEFVE